MIFVVETAVFLLRENTGLTLTRENLDDSGAVDVIRLLEGKTLGVFSRRKQLLTPTAVVGIRGSGVYTDAELILLESMVGRRPPFVESEGHGY